MYNNIKKFYIGNHSAKSFKKRSLYRHKKVNKGRTQMTNKYIKISTSLIIDECGFKITSSFCLSLSKKKE